MNSLFTVNKIRQYATNKGYEIMNTKEDVVMFSAPYEDQEKILKYFSRIKAPTSYHNRRYSWDYKEVIFFIGGTK